MKRVIDNFNSSKKSFFIRNIIICSILFCEALNTSHAQTYTLSNTTATNCRATLFDSNKGSNGSDYAHNESIVFHICIPEATSIELSFQSFCTEQNADFLRIYNGPDTTSQLIGTYSGNNSPSTINSSGNCLTLFFTSDNNISCTGFRATWRANIPEPLPPIITSISGQSCTVNTFNVNFNKKIHCDSLFAAAFRLRGINAPSIVSVSPINCIQDSATACTIILANNFMDNGTYPLNFIYRERDACDSLFTFNVSNNITINNCPINVTLMAAQDTVCQFGSTTIVAYVTGGDPNTYMYTWQPNSLPNDSGPHLISNIKADTIILVIVSDASAAPPDTAFFTIKIKPKPSLGSDTTYCQNQSLVTIPRNPTGGIFTGRGIVSMANGTWLAACAGIGADTIIYLVNGCADTTIYTVSAIDAGLPLAACPSAVPFLITSGTPVGGSWSGSVKVSSMGLFTPDVNGSYLLTYTAPNTCTDTLRVIVGGLSIQPNDSLCRNEPPYQLTFSPAGGRWSGTGITDSILGVFTPSQAMLGNNLLIYRTQNCADTLNIFVKNINAGFDFSACPSQGNITLQPATPAGGTWAGIGIINASTGLYNPAAMGGANFIDTITYTAQGCTDVIIGYVFTTDVRNDTLTTCIDLLDTLVPLTPYFPTLSVPYGGVWTGTGVVFTANEYYFNAKNASSGLHRLYYDINTCRDSLFILLLDSVRTQADTSVCLQTPAFLMKANIPNGTWQGTGVVTGTANFDPSIAGIGSHIITYTAPSGCMDTLRINVFDDIRLNVTPLDSVMCYTADSITLQASPVGGTWQGRGVYANKFVPADAGTTPQYITYTFQNAGCAATDSFKVQVLMPLMADITTPKTTICYGESIALEAIISGGNNIQNATITWSTGQNTRIINQRLYSTTTIYVSVNDGCSDIALDTLTIQVLPQVSVSVNVNDTVCFGENGFAIITNTSPAGNYTYTWNTSPATTGPMLTATAATYRLSILDVSNQCSTDTLITLPSYPKLVAFYTLNPVNDNCFTARQNPITFIDISAGIGSGFWDFGDGKTTVYQSNTNVSHSYADTGTYLTKLIGYNSFGCADTFLEEICVKLVAEILVPNIFTPNADGLNDVFNILPINTSAYTLNIYNRWGQAVFTENGTNSSHGWDGGNSVEGVYIYIINYTDATTSEKNSQSGQIILRR